jgi:hypothetical protein
MLFFKRLSFAPVLATCLCATIQSQGFSFQAELFTVHSPLLREFCLVSFPLLTYMLKFSRFADLTSCCYKCYHIFANLKILTYVICRRILSTFHVPHCIVCKVAHRKQQTNYIISTNNEAGKLPGITQECNMHSNIH